MNCCVFLFLLDWVSQTELQSPEGAQEGSPGREPWEDCAKIVRPEGAVPGERRPSGAHLTNDAYPGLTPPKPAVATPPRPRWGRLGNYDS